MLLGNIPKKKKKSFVRWPEFSILAGSLSKAKRKKIRRIS